MPSSEPVASQRAGRRTKLSFVAVGILLVALVTIGVMVAGDPKSTSFVIAAGILGSLIASFLMLGVTGIVLGPSRDAHAAAAQRLDAALAILDVAFPLLAEATQHGLIVVKPKSHYSREDWRVVLRDAQEELLLVGHALDKWCEEDIRPLFEGTLERLARNGKTVQLLTLPLEGANTTRTSNQREKRYGLRVQRTHDVVAAVSHRLPPGFRSSLCVRALSGDVDMPYMLVANEHVIITCAYPAAAQSSDSMLTTKAHRDTPFGRALSEDVRQFIERYTEPVSFPPRDS